MFVPLLPLLSVNELFHGYSRAVHGVQTATMCYLSSCPNNRFLFDTLATFNEYTVDLKLTQIRESGSLVSQLYSTFLLANNLARRHRYVPRVPRPITRNTSDGHPLKIANKLRTISGTAALTPPWNTQVNRTRAMGRYGAVILRTGVSMQHSQIALLWAKRT